MEFKLKQDKDKLFVIIIIDGKEHEKEVTEYFSNANPHDDWLDYKIGITPRNIDCGDDKNGR